ncbi:TcdA/TcdB catalytic glycosyltransferase domain-containing protein [Xenorhabdus hominickii]|uniref:Dot/Icm type IV secretion system effector SetA n=1 Tax=Xenorhabdus hominickii TaxID=351679 RepID=A0A2G0QEZ6_XENHO|nr:TcdA/TcdB catalytic glycosyltransferase domain-containing protein [Xenorhabdus hominickii]AOM41834.1 hypothetical protein A9255_15485 [Xenorhabdus hominickii]PHM57802.1 Dot/Icm type IV secretion system effector SetA [Xenorhabdus hominickii]
MNIPNKIHYFWVGNNVPKKLMMNIIVMKMENPGFEINLWVINKSLITKAFNEMIEKISFSGKEVNVGDLFGCEFDKLRRNVAKDYDNSIGKISLNSFFIREIAEVSDVLRSSSERFLTLESMFYRNINGHFQNYALASDIARLVILYAEGGIYLDADVQLEKTDLTVIYREAKFRYIDAPLGISFGNVRGDEWKDNNFGGNAIIAAPAKSKEILTILRIANNKFDLTKIPIYKSADETRSSSSRRTNHSTNLLHPTKQIKLLNLANPSESVTLNRNNEINYDPSKKYPNGRKDTWVASRVIPEFRFEAACSNTGPDIYKEHLNNIDKNRIPGDRRPSVNFRFEKNGSRYFKKVDACGNWREPKVFREKDRDIFHVDTEFTLSTNMSLTNHEMIKLLKKLKWS